MLYSCFLNHGMIVWELKNSHTFFDSLLCERWGSNVNVPFQRIWEGSLSALTSVIAQKWCSPGIQPYDTGRSHSRPLACFLYEPWHCHAGEALSRWSGQQSSVPHLCHISRYVRESFWDLSSANWTHSSHLGQPHVKSDGCKIFSKFGLLQMKTNQIYLCLSNFNMKDLIYSIGKCSV